jgi:hypothetical protein
MQCKTEQKGQERKEKELCCQNAGTKEQNDNFSESKIINQG